MPWFKVSDQVPFSPKFVDLPLPAVGLWTLAGAWCSQHLTDGQLTARMVTRLGGTDDDVAELVKAGLWHLEPDGYRFHDWHEYQPKREDVLAEREQARSRMERLRKQRKGIAAGTPSADDEPPTAEDDEPPPPVDDVRPNVPANVPANVQPNNPRTFGDSSADVRAPRPNPVPVPTAAAAAAAPRGAAAGDPLDELQARCRAVGLKATWRKLAAGDRAEIAQLIEVHGVPRLVASAQREHNPNEPARYVQAWLPRWRELTPPRTDSARTTSFPECPDHPGEHAIKCPQCARTGKGMPAGFREAALRGRRVEEPDDDGQDLAEDLADVEADAP